MTSCSAWRTLRFSAGCLLALLPTTCTFLCVFYLTSLHRPLPRQQTRASRPPWQFSMESWTLFNETLLLICRRAISFPWSWLPLRERAYGSFYNLESCEEKRDLQCGSVFIALPGLHLRSAERSSRWHAVARDGTLVSWTCPDHSRPSVRPPPSCLSKYPSATLHQVRTRPWRKPDPYFGRRAVLEDSNSSDLM